MQGSRREGREGNENEGVKERKGWDEDGWGRHARERTGELEFWPESGVGSRM
jgi:hypothetical protein